MWCKSGRVMGITLALSRSFSGAAFDLHRTFYSSRLIVGKSGSPKSSQLQSCPVQTYQSYVVHRQSVDKHRAINKVSPKLTSWFDAFEGSPHPDALLFL